MGKRGRKTFVGQKSVSVLMAAANGMNCGAPLALPYFAAATDLAKTRETVTEEWLAARWNGGQLLDRLFFTTTLAADVTGWKTVSAGETADGDIVHNGGVQQVYGSATNTTLNYDGWQYVYLGGSATSTTVNSSGEQYVWSGGSASNTTINSGGNGYVDGSAVFTTVNSGGSESVNGRTTNTTVNSGAQAVVGGSATATTVSSGGVLLIGSGGSATGATLAAGYVLQADTSATLEANGGAVAISGGLAMSVTLNSGGVLGVLSGHSATSTTVNGGGLQYISGGSAIDTTVNGGGQIVDSGGSATVTIINSGGEQHVLSGGSATNTTVNDSGLQLVYSGGTATSTTVQSGGTLALSGGSATDTTANAGGVIALYSGAALSGTTQLNGATISANDVSGAYHIADMVVTGGGTVRLANGTTIGNQLTIGQLSGAANFVINTDLARGQADKITITSAVAAEHTVRVDYDPGYATGSIVSGAAEFATVPDGTTFRALSTEYGPYQYTPELSVGSGGTSWAVTRLVPNGGVSETMYTAAAFSTGSLMLWRGEINDLTRRMGELRNDSGKAGEWLRIYRGALEATGTDGRRTTAQYTAFQGGYDTARKTVEGTWHTGFSLGYLSGDLTAERGRGDYGSLSVGAYGSWLGDKGHFLDIIVKQARLRNSYSSYLNNGAATEVTGSYKNWGTSLSAEYGHRRQLAGGWYLEPQAEITFGRISGADYTASDGTAVHNGAIGTTVGRLGVAYGRNTAKSTFYAKVSVAREFSAKSEVTMSLNGLPAVTREQNLKGTWLEYALGLTATNGKTNTYLEISKTTGSDVRTPWMVNVGLRMVF